MQILIHPPSGKHGWPWIVVPEKFPELTPSGKPWPKISIVTPSYNQGQFLEETIRSVLLQGYPNLEYIIMDGGSTDNSVEIIKKYEPWLTSWVSEKDNGQADAIHRGFEKATGEIIGWLNSDDYLLPRALKAVGAEFAHDLDLEFVIGAGICVLECGKLNSKIYAIPQDFISLMCVGQLFMQMSSFWRASIYREVGGLDTSLHFAFDYDLFLRLAHKRTPKYIEKQISAFRVHSMSKTMTIFDSVGLPELKKIRERYFSSEFTEETCAHLRDDIIWQYHKKKRYANLKQLFLAPSFFLYMLGNKLKSFKL